MLVPEPITCCNMLGVATEEKYFGDWPRLTVSLRPEAKNLLASSVRSFGSPKRPPMRPERPKDKPTEAHPTEHSIHESPEGRAADREGWNGANRERGGT